MMTTAAPDTLPTIDEIIDNFSLLEEWEDRYRYVIELGRGLCPLPERDRTEANKVQGCASQVWLATTVRRHGADGALLTFLGDSDAHIVRGLAAIRCCLREGLHVYLLEWLPASRDDAEIGLDQSTLAIADCVTRVTAADESGPPFLIGHSLGGTLAAIYAASTPDSIKGLVLLGAPLCFAPQTSEFRDALVSLVPPMLSESEPFPGSLLSHMSALASPHTFIWERLMDAALTFTDAHAMEIHARIERWALDEVALPGKLVHQIIDELYRDNRFYRGELTVRDDAIGPARLTAPTLAVVNTSDDVAPPAAIEPFVAAMPAGTGRIIRYPGEVGVGLQHLAILVGRRALAEIWPQIMSWLRAQVTKQS